MAKKRFFKTLFLRITEEQYNYLRTLGRDAADKVRELLDAEIKTKRRGK